MCIRDRVCKVTYHPRQRPELIEADIVCTVRPEKLLEATADSLDSGDEGASQAATKAQAAQIAAQQAALGHETLMEKQQYVMTVDGIPSLHDRIHPETFEDPVDASATMSTDVRAAAKRKGGSRRGSVMSMVVGETVSTIAEPDNRWKLFLNIEAMAVEPETYRMLHPKYDCALITKDTDACAQTIDLASVGCQDWNAQEGDLIKSTMCDLMKHVAKDLDVAYAFETVDEVTVPYFCQFNSGGLTPAAQRSAAALEKVKSCSEAQRDRAAGAARAMKSFDIGDVASSASESLAMVKATQVHARNEQLNKAKEEKDELKRLHRDEKFYYSIANILENTMSNLVFEASYQEFDLTKAPRQLVTVVDDEE
eukprot:TRINITY_DN10687_c0_g2_i5.p1 TRINITY_DN10687_c0_g2~~TRINITY_DN10687_c0_g2_i5.p1  ORF type:complete len:367 (+),score=99.98 TRINITY_DN10687_c0_g2_i5:87-1187(+)